MSNLDYYKSVEETYNYYYWASPEWANENDDILYYESQRLFTNGGNILLSDPYNLVWDDLILNATECSVETMLDYIGPSDSTFDIWSFLLLY